MTVVSPISETDLAMIAHAVRAALAKRFGERRVDKWLRRDLDLAQAFARETFLATRVHLHAQQSTTRPQ
jgi:hypothetical protein